MPFHHLFQLLAFLTTFSNQPKTKKTPLTLVSGFVYTCPSPSTPFNNSTFVQLAIRASNSLVSYIVEIYIPVYTVSSLWPTNGPHDAGEALYVYGNGEFADPALLPANFTCRFIFSTGGVYVVPANVTGASSFVVCNFTSILPTHNNATSMIVEVGYFGSGWQQVPTPYLFVSRPNITLLTPAFGPYHTILAGGALPVSSGAPSTMTTVVTEQSVSEPITSYVWATATGTGFFCCNMLAAILDIPTNKSLENYLGALVASSSSSTTCTPLTFPEAIDNKQLFSGSSQLLSWDLNPTRQRMIPTT